MTSIELVNALVVSVLATVIVAGLFYYFNINWPDNRKPAPVRVRVDDSRRRTPPPPPREERKEYTEKDIFFWLMAAFVTIWVIIQQL